MVLVRSLAGSTKAVRRLGYLFAIKTPNNQGGPCRINLFKFENCRHDEKLHGVKLPTIPWLMLGAGMGTMRLRI